MKENPKQASSPPLTNTKSPFNKKRPSKKEKRKSNKT